MKRIITLLMSLVACVLSACNDKEPMPETIKPFPFGTEEAELSRQIESPSFPKLKEGHIISWHSTCDQVMDAISDTKGYSILKYPAGSVIFISVKKGDARWDFAYEGNGEEKLAFMFAGQNTGDVLTGRPSVTRYEPGGRRQYFLYDNTIVARVESYTSITYYPRSREIIDKYKLN